jgi:beta-galactosidase
MGNPKIAGSFGWQFVDYNTHEQFGSGDHVCYHGIMDAFRLPKPAASIYSSQMEKPYLSILNSADIGDYDAGFIDSFVIATNCEYIEVYQNDRFVGKYYPDYHQFPHLKHPPIIIDDLYGDAYEDLNLSKTRIEELKNIAKDLAKRGGLDKLTAQDEYNPEDIQLAWQMYGKYIANWGSLSFLYTIKGFHPKADLTRKLGPYKNYTIVVDMEHTEIYIEDTFDVSRIEIQAVDDLGNLKPYAFDVISIQTNSVLEVIGETYVSLIGGKRTIWVRTKEKGIGIVQITHKNSVIEKHIHVN